MTVENTERIKRQNQDDCKILVIIGNPPYNAKQENFNQNNANRIYKNIDQRIKETYVKEGKAQNQIVVYDMYTRFIRWASDRLGKQGVICFITNSSFLDARAFDGFRKVINEEFSYAYFLDLGGNVRAISGKDGIFIGEKHTIFGISAMTGIVISFLVKDSQEKTARNRIYYSHPFHIHELRDNKLKFLSTTKFADIDFEHIIPDKRYNWLNLTDNDFDELLPLIDKDVKSGKSQEAVFKLFSRGVVTQRDEWVYDFYEDALVEKVKYLIEVYQQTLKDENYLERMTIKWDRELTKYLGKKISKKFEGEKIFRSFYRPYVKQFFYFDKHFNGMTYQWFVIHQDNEVNYYISLPGIGSSKPFQCLITNQITCLDCLEKNQCLPLYYYDENGKRQDNITDWSLQKFQCHYNNKRIKKLDIFHYTYAVLHHPTYRQKYEQNLKREFPRLPFYENFQHWVKMGKKLIDLHINYETIKPFPLTRIDLPTPENSPTPKPKLKADKTKDKIFIDTITTLEKIPKIAWEYRLGNRSALEWILDQYKEKKPRDKTIAEKFNTYRFANYKETVIDLLQKVCTVSVETMKIIQAMETTDKS